MFCPECGTLSFPDPNGNIACTNYKCGYNGPANIVIKGTDGKDVDLSKAVSKPSLNLVSMMSSKILTSDTESSLLEHTCARSVMLSKFSHILNKPVLPMNLKHEC